MVEWDLENYQVNILDIIVTVNHVAGHIDLNGQQIENADMNLDGIINILDIVQLVNIIVS